MAKFRLSGTEVDAQAAAERERLVYQLIAAAAERDLGTVYGAVGAAALEAITAGLRPGCEFAPPPSYQAFMATFGSLRVLDAAGEVAGVWVYTPGEALARTSEVRRGGGDHHLVAFADDGRGGHWCFDTRGPGPELPVCGHRRGQVEDGGRAPGYPDFMAWLRAEIGAERGPD